MAAQFSATVDPGAASNTLLDDEGTAVAWEWVNDIVTWWSHEGTRTGAAVVATGSGVIAASSGVRALRQNRRDSKAKSRPMVAAELREIPYTEGSQMLVVRNYGPSIARDVRVTFDPEIPDGEHPEQGMTQFLKRRYASPISVLTPGMELDNIYYSARRDDGGKKVNNEPTPDQVTVTITYKNDAGQEFTDHFPIDTNLLRNRTYSESSASFDGRLKDITAAMKTLAHAAGHEERRRASRENAAWVASQKAADAEVAAAAEAASANADDEPAAADAADVNTAPPAP